MDNILRGTGLMSRGHDYTKSIVTISQYIRCTLSIQDCIWLMRAVPSGTALMSWMYEVMGLMRTMSECILLQRLIKSDMGPTRHYEICTREQIDHNTYDQSQYVTLTHDASADSKKFGDASRAWMTFRLRPTRLGPNRLQLKLI